MRWLFNLFFPFFILISCNKHWHTADLYYSKYEVDRTNTEEHPLNDLIIPYKEQLDFSMDEVIGILDNNLTKQKPESTLGNWVADILLEEVEKMSGKK